MKVLFFHGSGGGSIAELGKMFKKQGLDLISPEISYYDFIGNEFMFPMLDKLAKEADVIVGNSMGGWFAYHLGIKNDKQVLLFNPAISNKTQSFKCFNDITPDISNIKLDKTMRVLLSDKDEVVNHEFTRDKLAKTNCSDIRISDMVGEKHNIDFRSMISEIFDFCSNLETA